LVITLGPTKRTRTSSRICATATSRGDGHGGAGGRGAGLDGGALVKVVLEFAPAITIINMVKVAVWRVWRVGQVI
jgi:hypothetical protein